MYGLLRDGIITWAPSYLQESLSRHLHRPDHDRAAGQPGGRICVQPPQKPPALERDGHGRGGLRPLRGRADPVGGGGSQRLVIIAMPIVSTTCTTGASNGACPAADVSRAGLSYGFGLLNASAYVGSVASTGFGALERKRWLDGGAGRLARHFGGGRGAGSFSRAAPFPATSWYTRIGGDVFGRNAGALSSPAGSRGRSSSRAGGCRPISPWKAPTIGCVFAELPLVFSDVQPAKAMIKARVALESTGESVIPGPSARSPSRGTSALSPSPPARGGGLYRLETTMTYEGWDGLSRTRGDMVHHGRGRRVRHRWQSNAAYRARTPWRTILNRA